MKNSIPLINRQMKSTSVTVLKHFFLRLMPDTDIFPVHVAKKIHMDLGFYNVEARCGNTVDIHHLHIVFLS
jgi:hypothetical protein